MCDTGAVDSFILQSMLSFLEQSCTGDVLICGIGLNTVPLHKANTESDFVQGEVILGVRPALPVDGVYILGNAIAGQCICPDTPFTCGFCSS